MILNVEPGGWGAETARPASARTAPSRGRITATPPILSPSAAVRRAHEPRAQRRVQRAARDGAGAGHDPCCRTAAAPTGARPAARRRRAAARSASAPRRRRSTRRARWRPGACRRRRGSDGAAAAARRAGGPSRRRAARAAAAAAASRRPRCSPLPDTASATVARSVPKSRRRTATGTDTRPSRSSASRPARTDRTAAARSALR